jgi:hypothetical protein
MNFPSELRKAKQVIREWIRTHFSDEKLASVAALNEDGKMGFRTPCGCLLGVTYSDPLHVGHDCNHEHYRRARRQDLALLSPSGMGPAEKAYLFLGFTAVFRNCFGDDEVRRRRFLPSFAPRCVAETRENGASVIASLLLSPVILPGRKNHRAA